MAAHASSRQSTGPIDAAQSETAEPVPVQRSGTELAVRAPAGRTQKATPSVTDGIRAAAAVVGWALWILLVLTMAAFLAFAPSFN